MDRKTRTQYVKLLRQAIKVADAEGLTEDSAALASLVAARKPVPAADDPRVIARRLGTFTVTELQEALGRSRPTAMAVLSRLIDQDVVRDSGLRQKHDGPGRPAPVYEVVPIEAKPRNREKRLPPEVEVRHTFRPSSSKPSNGGSGKRSKITNREVRKLVEVARKNGCRIEAGNQHIRVLAPRGGIVILPSTPSDHRSLLNARSEMRRAGIPV